MLKSIYCFSVLLGKISNIDMGEGGVHELHQMSQLLLAAIVAGTLDQQEIIFGARPSQSEHLYSIGIVSKQSLLYNFKQMNDHRSNLLNLSS